MTELEKEVIDEVKYLTTLGKLKVNKKHEIEYTQKWLDHWLGKWSEYGYSEEEVQAVKKYFENLEYDDEIEKHYIVSVLKYPNGNREYEWKDEVANVTMRTKKIG